MNSVAWARKALRHEEKLIREADVSQETREKAVGCLVKLAYYMMEDSV